MHASFSSICVFGKNNSCVLYWNNVYAIHHEYDMALSSLLESSVVNDKNMKIDEAEITKPESKRAARGGFPLFRDIPSFFKMPINFKYKMHHQNEDGTVFLLSHIYNNASVPLPMC